MELGMRVIKYMLFIFNLLFAVSGIALIVTGAVAQAVYYQYLDFIGNRFISPAVLFIIIGVVIFFVSFFGCCGAIRENICMIITFAVLLGFIFICEVAGGIATYVLRGEVRHILAENMGSRLKNYNQTGHEGVTQVWNLIHVQLHCCGVNNYSDWFSTPFGNESRVPDSCCVNWSPGCGSELKEVNETNVYERGCFDGLTEVVQHNAGAFAGVGIGIAVIQSIGIIFASLLAKTVQRYSPVRESIM